jgi:putative ABC transport system ATP-binding protein
MADTNPVLIKMDGVKKVFYTDEVETHALEEIHLEIRKGEYISIAGPSGCGKSTLLSILGLLDSPSDGAYMLNGQPVAKLTISERTRIRNREIGFIFQAFNLIGDLTVYENVELLSPAGWDRRRATKSPAPSGVGTATAFATILRNSRAVSNSVWLWLAHWSAIRSS